MTSHDVIQASVAAHNRRAEKAVRDIEPLARVAVATAMALLAAWALVTWATPCADAQLCAGLLALPRRAVAQCGQALAGSWLHRALVWPQSAYLRMRISVAQNEVDDMQACMRNEVLTQPQIQHYNAQIRSHELWIVERQIKLIDLDLSSRAPVPKSHYGGTQ